ncbi:uncharacterized protein RJT20DRAFT_125102 [Scheffersomyces xylosifermentans]|uniref:uncharacterized protein n=1 Tax=Scheffersomyces xylosifermentans TaxID=1304137 RepID=UPI00315DF555
MSEVSKPATTSRLKKLTSGSSWVSPFRTGGEAGDTKKVSLLKQYKDSNKIDNIRVPARFTVHPTLEAEERRKKEEAAAKKKAEEEAEKAEAAEVNGVKEDGDAAVEESADEPKEEVETLEEPITEAKDETEEAEAAAEEAEPETVETLEQVPLDADEPAKDKPAEDEPVKEATEEGEEKPEGEEKDEEKLDIVTQPTKIEPVEEDTTNKEVYEKLKDKPLLLNRYEALNAQAAGSVSRRIDDPKKIVDLGSGLKMSQAQLLEIARQRVAPVLANINDEVSKTRNEDEIKRQQELSTKVKGHEKKLLGDFEKHSKKLGKKKEKFDKEHTDRIGDLIRLQTNADNAAAEFQAATEGEIETAKAEFSDREAKAIEKHGNDKETLLKNHEELEATKKQELEDAKLNQEKTTTEIEELQEKKSGLDNTNSELSTQIEELTEKLNTETAKLDELKSKHDEVSGAVTKNLSTKEELTRNIATTKKDLEDKKSKHIALTAEVGALAGVLGAYAAKLSDLHSDKEVRSKRLGEAKEKFVAWDEERKKIAADVARQHEKQRAEAQEAAETKRVQDELERKRLKEEREAKEQEEKEEKERQEKKEAEEKAIREKKEAEEKELKAKKDAEEKERLEKEQAEWEEKEALLKQQAERDEAERLKSDPEHLRSLRAKQREAEEEKLLKETEEQEKIHAERKAKEQAEYESLLAEIEDLKNKKQAQVDNERLEAEKIAQAKLLEIERLKEEHDARLRLLQKKLENEELQKQRLLEEVDNLRKIKELREEKAKLASEVQQSSSLDDIKKLIEERELEVARLSKQIELGDDDLYKSVKENKTSFLGKSNDLSEIKSDTRAIPESKVSIPAKKDIAEPVVEEKKKKSNGGVIGATIGAVAGAAAGAAAVATSAKPNGASNVSKSSGPERSGSISKTFKNFRNRLSLSGESSKPLKSESKEVKSKSKEVKKDAAAIEAESSNPFTDKSALTNPVVALDAGDDVVTLDTALVQAPSEGKHIKVKDVTAKERQEHPSVSSHGVDGGALDDDADDSEYETYSIYEEVEDDEYEAHKGDPDYFEVTSGEFALHSVRA